MPHSQSPPITVNLALRLLQSQYHRGNVGDTWYRRSTIVHPSVSITPRPCVREQLAQLRHRLVLCLVVCPQAELVRERQLVRRAHERAKTKRAAALPREELPRGF